MIPLAVVMVTVKRRMKVLLLILNYYCFIPFFIEREFFASNILFVNVFPFSSIQSDEEIVSVMGIRLQFTMKLGLAPDDLEQYLL